jgi:hypothetical protein
MVIRGRIKKAATREHGMRKSDRDHINALKNARLAFAPGLYQRQTLTHPGEAVQIAMEE